MRSISVVQFERWEVGPARIHSQRTKWEHGNAGNFVRMINRIVVMRMLLATFVRPIGIVTVSVIFLMLVCSVSASDVLTDCHEIFADIGMGERPEKCRNRKSGK